MTYALSTEVLEPEILDELPIKSCLVSYCPQNNSQVVAVGSHEIQNGGSCDGYCSTHNSYNCYLTEQEIAEFSKVLDSFFNGWEARFEEITDACNGRYRNRLERRHKRVVW